MCVGSQFKKSTESSDQNGCVEVECHHHEGFLLVRDSKDPDGPVLNFTNKEWEAFRAGVLAGEFDL